MSDLRAERAPGKIEFGNGGKILAAAIVAAAIAAAGVYTYHTAQVAGSARPVVTNGATSAGR